MFPQMRQYRKAVRISERHNVILDGSAAYLTWAMQPQNTSPRIPTRSGQDGGYSDMIQRPGARAAANHYWAKALSA